MSLARLPEVLYRRLLVLYPPHFREAFGEELVEFFAESLVEARRRGRLAAARAVAVAFGDVVESAFLERLHERRNVTRRRRSAAPRGRSMMDPLRLDLGAALRVLRHRPAMAFAAVATLALAIAANAAVFALVDAVLFRPLPYSEPDRIATVWNLYGSNRTESSPPDFLDRRRESRLAEAVAAIDSTPMSLSERGEARRVETSRVTSRFFDVFGVAPRFGAAVFPDEVAGSPERIALLSYRLWRGAFGGEESVVGTTVRLDGEAYAIVGVLPEGFDFPRGTDVWMPLVFSPGQLADAYRGNEYLTIVARARHGVSSSELDREMESIAARVVERVPERRRFLLRNGWGASVVPLREYLAGDSRPALAVLAAAVVVVLLLAGANVSHLLLASASARAVELRVRASLGATRGRIASQLVVESLVLSAAGAAAGLALAYGLVRSLPRLAPEGLAGLDRVAFDARALVFTVLVSLVMGILCGLAPAWQATDASAGAAGTNLQSTASRRVRRLRNGLVVSEVALALVLLVAGGLLVRSFQRLSSREPGFASEGRVSFGVDFPRFDRPREERAPDGGARSLGRLRSLPEVRAAAVADRLPLGGRKWTATFRPEGYALAAGESIPGADLDSVSPGYLQSIGIPLSSGRDFTDDDTAESRGVVLVDEWTEKRFWPGGAVGKRIDFGGGSEARDLREIVGVVGHVRYESLDEPGRFQIYFPWTQSSWRHLDFVLATNVDATAIVPRVRRAVAGVAPDLAVQSVRGLESLVADTLAVRKLSRNLVAAFGLVALLLTAVGIYGVLSYSVAQRSKEVGLRMALGASRAMVLGSVMREGLLLALWGGALGCVGALLGSRLLSSLLFGIRSDRRADLHLRDPGRVGSERRRHPRPGVESVASRPARGTAGGMS